MLLAAEHRAAARRELFEAHFSPLQLTQEVPAWMEKNDRKVYVLRVLHMKAILNVVLGRYGALCFSVHQFCFFSYASITYLELFQ